MNQHLSGVLTPSLAGAKGWLQGMWMLGQFRCVLF
jgi:hypothetical protein